MYNGIFDLISTASLQAPAIPVTAFSSASGYPGKPTVCPSQNDYMAICFAAGCLNSPYTNPGGPNSKTFPTTCYCPVYKANPSFILPGSSAYGFECKGQGPYLNGVPSYVQNGT